MSDDPSRESPEKDAANESSVVDLSSLKDLSFGPSWTTGTPPKPAARPERDRFERRGPPRERFDRRPPPRDRRDSRRPNEGAPRQGFDGQRRRFDRRPGDERRGPPRDFAPLFRPTAEVLFYPEDAAFRALTKAIRTSYRTYELFEVAHLILEKPERFVAVIKPLPNADAAQKFYQSVPDALVFESEQQAVNHVLKDFLDRFFTIEQVDVEPPKGSFVGVNKSLLSGELIAPPNYHRYQELLRLHHTERYPTMSFERFASQIELDKDPETVNAWLEKMKKTARYTEKNPAEGAEAKTFDSLSAAREYLLAHHKEKIVRETTEARMPGRLIAQMPQGPLRRSVEMILQQQIRFPLISANNLRGRLRRMKFGLYKRGSKGISFVCAVKRRFREEGTVFAQNLQDLITFIEKTPYVNVKDLPEKFLGIAPAQSEADKTPLKDATAQAEAQDAVEPPPEASAEVEAPVQTLAAEQTAPVETTASAPEATPSVSEASAATMPNADIDRIKALLKDLHWLVSEGYVTEFGDGRLFAPPPMPAAKVKQAEAQDAAEHHDSALEAAVQEVQADPQTQEEAPAQPQQSESTPEETPAQ